MKAKLFLQLCFTILNLGLFSTLNCLAQGTWAQKANYGGGIIDLAVGFSIGNKGYIATGEQFSAANLKTDLWEYDTLLNTWTQKANLPGIPRCYAVAFSIGTKGYIGTGWEGTITLQDFWEWDQTTNTWSQKADFGGIARYGATGFSIGTKGYIGTGNDTTYTQLQDFWEWDQASNTWTQKADFGGTPRVVAVGFSIGNKGYIGTGSNGSSGQTNDFWEYDPSFNSWIQKANLPGAARSEGVGFSNGYRGYVGNGYDGAGFKNDFWEYDPASNSWTQIANYGGGTRYANVGFAIGCIGYVGTGYNGPQWDDFWEYTPNPSPCTLLTLSISSQNVLCYNQCTGTATVTPTNGTAPYTYSWGTVPVQTTQVATALCAGAYTVTVTDVKNITATATVTITQPTVLSFTNTITNDVCLGKANGSAFVNVSGGTPLYVYSWLPSVGTNANATGLSVGIYILNITDANGCEVTDSLIITDKNCGGGPYFPNAFTPNSDNKNDIFPPVVDGVEDFTMRIFNRWGDLLFESTDINKGWDGTYKGNKVEQEVYVCFITYTDGNKNNQKMISRLTLVK